ncbi:hypothetical protein EC178900_3000, partial [Escherichia coli 178900]
SLFITPLKMTALKNIYQNGHFSIHPSQECPFSA